MGDNGCDQLLYALFKSLADLCALAYDRDGSASTRYEQWKQQANSLTLHIEPYNILNHNDIHNAYECFSITEEQDWKTGQYFAPYLRYRRTVNKYEIDLKPKTTKKQRNCRGELECERNGDKYKIKTPGLLTVFCSHDLCVGFQILTESESPKHVFQFFYHRFSEAPKIIFYDRGC
jgi:hypothetical protein